MQAARKKVLVAGATGTIGQAVASALIAHGYEALCLVRKHSGALPPEARQIIADVTDPASLATALYGERPDAFISCLASRTGAPDDAWAIDHRANLNLLEAAKESGASHGVLLSAICVQKPLLAFQHAKLAFEEALIRSGLIWSIVRPTAFFKSLSGQLDRVRAGKPFLVFGDGRLTACKPISNEDLATFIVGCLDDPARQNAMLPIGGPGSALTPLDQGRALFEATGIEPKFKHVPVGLISAIIGGLSLAEKVVPSLAAKAELARIGRYYATESMLVWDEAAGRYDAEGTPAFGQETLQHFYGRLARGEASVERGEHAVF